MSHDSAAWRKCAATEMGMTTATGMGMTTATEMGMGMGMTTATGRGRRRGHRRGRGGGKGARSGARRGLEIATPWKVGGGWRRGRVSVSGRRRAAPPHSGGCGTTYTLEGERRMADGEVVAVLENRKCFLFLLLLLPPPFSFSSLPSSALFGEGGGSKKEKKRK